MKKLFFLIVLVSVLAAFSLPLLAESESQPTTVKTKKERKKKFHPFDIFPHEMHTALFESVTFSCDNCHKDPDSFTDHSKINRLGCHMCHNNPNPPLPGSQECSRCHPNGQFPKPESHKVDWLKKHQVYAKQDPKYCSQCHSNQMFCMDCHQKRETVEQRVHKRNWKFYHSIEARANPHKCDACHTVNYCQECHSGGESSKR